MGRDQPMRKPPPRGAKPSNTSSSTPSAQPSCSWASTLVAARPARSNSPGWRGADAAAACGLAPGVVLVFLGLVMKAAMLPVRIDYQMHPRIAPTPVSGYISAVLLKSGPWGVLKLFVLFGGAALFSKLGGEVNGSRCCCTSSPSSPPSPSSMPARWRWSRTASSCC